MTKRPNILSKDGLSGNSGLGVDGGIFFHIAANYAAGCRGLRKMCFVETRGLDGDPVPSWRRMTLARAKKEKRRIITCSMCQHPAISLDHYWPYFSDGCYCARHREAVRNRFADPKTA